MEYFIYFLVCIFSAFFSATHTQQQPERQITSQWALGEQRAFGCFVGRALRYQQVFVAHFAYRSVSLCYSQLHARWEDPSVFAIVVGARSVFLHTQRANSVKFNVTQIQKFEKFRYKNKTGMRSKQQQLEAAA